MIYCLKNKIQKPYIMKQIISLLITILLVSFSTQPATGKVTKEAVDSATILYAGGEFDRCISMAKEHEWEYNFWPSDEELKQTLLIYGALSYRAKLFRFQTSDNKSNLDMILWATRACNFFDKWLKDHLKYNTISEETVSEYFTNLELALSGYSVISDVMDGITKRYDKMSSKWIKNAHNKFYKIRSQWSGYPMVQLMILKNAITYYAQKDKGLSKLPSNILDEYWNAIDILVSMSEASRNPMYTSVIANSYVQDLYSLFLSDIHSKHPNYIGSLDVMLKSRDFSLFAQGAKQYRDFKNASFKKVQNSLNDGEFCMEHFESQLLAGHYYASWDPTSRRRNYAFVFDNKMREPALWHRGYINNIESQGFEGVIKHYPECKIVYSTGTDYMALKDFVGNNSMVRRRHSLSHIKDSSNSDSFSDLSFIGCINFSHSSDSDSIENSTTKGLARSTRYKSFSTDEPLLTQLTSLNIDNFKYLTRGNVNRQSFIATLANSNFIHISTHGIFDAPSLSVLNEELGIDAVNGTNVLKNCKLLLSRYNDDNSQYISGDDIRSLDLSHINLLFLDACQTGDGRQIGLGSYSLAEAFHLAGVRNIIATLDLIDPNITYNFSVKFYGLLKQGNNIHDSFYLVKNDVCPNERIILWE